MRKTEADTYNWPLPLGGCNIEILRRILRGKYFQFKNTRKQHFLCKFYLKLIKENIFSYREFMNSLIKGQLIKANFKPGVSLWVSIKLDD